jgi:hypothetical protein
MLHAVHAILTIDSICNCTPHLTGRVSVKHNEALHPVCAVFVGDAVGGYALAGQTETVFVFGSGGVISFSA